MRGSNSALLAGAGSRKPREVQVKRQIQRQWPDEAEGLRGGTQKASGRALSPAGMGEVDRREVIIVFEGRDTAGKGGMIKAITERVSPRVFRVVALRAPCERERTQMFLQRYIEHFPAAGRDRDLRPQLVQPRRCRARHGLLQRERHRALSANCARIRAMARQAGIILIKLWLEVGKKEQERRFDARVDDPLRQWKLSPMDIKSYSRWYDYSRARDAMFEGDRHQARALVSCVKRRQEEGRG